VGCTYLSWYLLIRRYVVSKPSAFTFITPLFGVAAGHYVLGEAISPSFLAATAFVTMGLMLVNRAR
jgi:drug/metabolite transporter (DMT)-like permease